MVRELVSQHDSSLLLRKLVIILLLLFLHMRDSSLYLYSLLLGYSANQYHQKKIKTEITKKIIGFCWAQVFIKQSGKQKTGRKGRRLTEHQEGSRVSPPGRQPCWVSSHISHPAKGQPAVQTAGIPEQIAQTGSCPRKKGQSRTLPASQQKKEKSIPFPQ